MNHKEAVFDRMDLHHQPLYGLTEASRYIPGLAVATLRSWVKGRTYPLADGNTGQFPPLIKPPDSHLSFTNLVEAHVLYSLRSWHSLEIKDIRNALDYAESAFGIVHLLSRKELRAGAGSLFIERYGQLVNLSKSGQLGMKRILECCLERLVHDQSGWPIRYFPTLLFDDGERDVLIDPQVAFGKPVVAQIGVRVIMLADRINAGESVEDLAKDYGIKKEKIEKAVTYAQAA